MSFGSQFRLSLRSFLSSRSLKDVAWNFSGPVITTVILVLLAPLYIKFVGLPRYGVLTVLWVFLAYFGLMGLGLARAAANLCAKTDDVKEISEIFVSTNLFNMIFGAIFGVIFFLIYGSVLPVIVNATPDIEKEFLAAGPWLAAFLPFAAASGVLGGVLEGRRHFALSNQIQTLGTILFQATPFLVAFFYSNSLDVMIPVALVVRAGVILAGACATVRVLSIDLNCRFNFKLIRQMSSFGGWVSLGGIISPIIMTVDQFIISARIGSSFLPYYSISNSLIQRIHIFPLAVFRTIYPRISKLSEMEARALSERSVKILSHIITPAIIVGIFLVSTVLTIWLGAEFSQKATLPSQILLVGIWFNGLALMPFALLEGQGRPDLPVKYHLLELPFYLAGLLVGLQVAGIAGAAAASALRMAFDALLLVSAARFSRRTITGLGVSAAAVCAGFVVANLQLSFAAVWASAVSILALWALWVGVTRDW
ncbi:oligosaccharide flippase family protein [uncultured Bosea sp.]|uniref:oligosaccharide flippase family protein n=1 Tax=uncultured Bosea sp. TaxID=211457 RepID=UPI00263A4F92|nr:oligosaccharide flippase family protein [uncultured Bosea sp.]